MRRDFVTLLGGADERICSSLRLSGGMAAASLMR
jgi:hypothetical protein